ncbi:protein CutA [Sceloporus undulatus]|uniref:protein CutA n=1 Tax=Sceloporus undulatus TaxID=8520 RepID=UPI001C4B38B6|nr:protein CutA [Sceloporus undulatus]
MGVPYCGWGPLHFASIVPLVPQVLLLSLPLLMTALLQPLSASHRLLASFFSASASPSPAASMASTAGPEAPTSASSTYTPGTLSAAFVTCPNQMVAREIARAVVEKRLAACVNLVPQITSIYEWKGKIEEDSEVLLMIKTRSSRVSALAEFIRKIHPYEVAEVIAVPIQEGNPPYLRWVEEAVPEEKPPQ